MKELAFKLAVIVATMLAAGAMLADVGCCSTPPSNVAIVCINEAGPEEDFAQDKSDEALGLKSPCALACSNLATLGCSESKKPPGGDTCVVVCKKYVEISSYNPACVSAAKSKDAVRKCPLVKCP